MLLKAFSHIPASQATNTNGPDILHHPDGHRVPEMVGVGFASGGLR